MMGLLVRIKSKNEEKNYFVDYKELATIMKYGKAEL